MYNIFGFKNFITKRHLSKNCHPKEIAKSFFKHDHKVKKKSLPANSTDCFGKMMQNCFGQTITIASGKQ